MRFGAKAPGLEATACASLAGCGRSPPLLEALLGNGRQSRPARGARRRAPYARAREASRQERRHPGIRVAPPKRTHRRATLPQSPPCSTIAEAGLNFRVRDGIGCGPRSRDGGKTETNRIRPVCVRSLAKRSPGLSRAGHAQRKTTVEVKPHDRLVPVSSPHSCASTPGLSPSWSRRGL